MNSYKIVPNQTLSKEQQQQRLKEIIASAEKSGSKFFNNATKKDKSTISVLSRSGEKTDIVIPDINTFFYSGMAVAITNKASGLINYWYTFNGTEKWYYKYTVKKDDTTWNWQWADYLTHHCMIIEIPIDDGSGDSWFFIPAVVKYDAGSFSISSLPRINVYYTRAKADTPPSFTEKVWMVLYQDLYPDVRKMDLFNFHVTITCYDDTIEWDSSPRIN